MWGHRAQIDRDLYKQHMLNEMLGTENLTIEEKSVEDLILHQETGSSRITCGGVVTGTSHFASFNDKESISVKMQSIEKKSHPHCLFFSIRLLTFSHHLPLTFGLRPETADGEKIACKATVITTGTFLRGRICIGLDSFPAGRMGMRCTSLSAFFPSHRIA